MERINRQNWPEIRANLINELQYRGQRVAVISEPNTSHVINTNMLAQVTGNDTVQLRELISNPPSHARNVHSGQTVSVTAQERELVHTLANLVFEHSESFHEQQYIDLMNFLKKIAM
jgi:hypothetical protein